VGVALDLPGPEGQHRLGPVERLDLGLLVDGEDDRPLGRREVEPDDVADLGDELRIGAPLERLGPVGLEARLAQIRQTVVSLMPTRWASRRTLQWVVPAGGGSRVSAITRSRASRE
jgi:hypothetical protein